MSNLEILGKAYRANALLRERQKSLTKEHTERRKKLIALMEDVNKAEMTKAISGQTQIGGEEFAAVSLTPDVEDLLENPTHGL